jgi:acetyl-CoA carboxylase carboxyltransferase component
MPTSDIRAPLAGTIVFAETQPGARVRAGQVLLVIESMKMEHEVRAAADGEVVRVHVRVGDLVAEAEPLLSLAPAPAGVAGADAARDALPPAPGAAGERNDLKQVHDRHAKTLDAARPDAVARRHARGARTARENVADLCDPGSFIEYGALAVPAQSRRRSIDDLVANTPADGMVTGIGSINGAWFGPERSRCVVMAYDATVLAGTQGARNHQKTDRLLGIALAQALPVVLFAEGGGGRPGDVDVPVVAGLHVPTFASYARLSGRVPVIAVVAGRCFAGNAALAGCSDLIVATRDSNLGMGGPAMIEGGGLGVFRPEEIGPADVQARNGVIDVLVDDEAQAVAAVKSILAIAQGALPSRGSTDQRALRDAVPENRVRSYDVRAVIHALADTGSVLELRPAFGAGILTAFARFDGRPVALLANNPAVLGGAIDADAADKAARFLQLADSYALPVVSLIDTPGFMVGLDVETRAQVRHVSRLFVVGAGLQVPWFAVVLRKGYGLGAMAMAGGGMHAPVATIAWPTGEFGAMGLEGAVRLGFRKELEAVPEGPDRDALTRKLVDQQYDRGKAINMAATLEIDAVIDPADTRDWLIRGLAGTALRLGRDAAAPPRRFIDPW